MTPRADGIYTPQEIAEFYRVRDRVNAARREAGRARDSVTKADFDELIQRAQSSDAEERKEARRGIWEALSYSGTVIGVLRYLGRAREAAVLSARTVYLARLAIRLARGVQLIGSMTAVSRGALLRQLLAWAERDEAVTPQRVFDYLVDTHNLDEVEARRVALDQSRKYDGALLEAQQAAQGVRFYMWVTMRDERVRPTHAIKDGRIFSWAHPPPDTGHPGEDINCRCYAVPVIRRR